MVLWDFGSGQLRFLGSNYSPLWSAWSPLITPIIKAATQCYGYSCGRTARIMLANVRPGGRIERHVDQMPSAVTPHKIHVPIITNANVRFFEGEATYYLQRDHAYEVNNRIPHGVENASAHERIHLIFDYFEAPPHSPINS